MFYFLELKPNRLVYIGQRTMDNCYAIILVLIPFSNVVVAS